MVFNKGVGSASAPKDDSDLEDLIAKSPVGKRNSIEIDSSGTASSKPLVLITDSCRLCSYQFPCLSKCFLSLVALGFIAFLSNTFFNPTQQMGIMGADYSEIQSAYDLSLSKVDHWCINGDNDSCKCEDPLEPNSRSEFKSWNAAHKSNVADVNLYRAVYGAEPSMIDEETGKPRSSIDVAFLGESVVEAMDGRWLGKKIVRAINAADGKEGMEARKKPDIDKVFERLFRKEKGGPVEGVALGIAGDNTANVLWRLQHDEMPYDFNPKVWWLVLGMNDLTRMQCSEEIVVLGILRIVEEIRLRKPDAKIVINSLLPMINYQSMKQPKMADFADFKSDEKNGKREKEEIDGARRKFLGEEGRPGKGERNDSVKKTAFKEHGHGRRQLRDRKDEQRDRKDGKRDRKEEKRAVKRDRKDERDEKRDNKDKKKKYRHQDNDDATEGPALEKALERRKKMIEIKDKRFRNKEFRDDEKYHPKKPLSPLLPMIKKHVLPPVWPSVHLINDKLKEFCTKHEFITFFDATAIFATDEGGGKHHLHNELISPRGHPSAYGFAVWEGRIMGRLHKLMEKVVEERISPPDSNDDEQDDIKEDSEVEVLSPMQKVSVVSGASADGVEGSGDGAEHVSDGKESGPPPKVEQPSRSAPAKDGKKKDDGNKDDEDKDDGEQEHASAEKDEKKEEKDVEEEEEDDDEDEE